MTETPNTDSTAQSNLGRSQMRWQSKISGQDSEKILFLSPSGTVLWRPYNVFPQFAVPDYQIPGGSKGWATFQKLLKAGWELVPSN